MTRILFCNIGWASSYHGELDDKPTGDAAYIKNGGVGHEIANFALSDGFYYGFIETKTVNGKPREIHIENIEKGFENSDAIDHVLVIWCAPDKKRGGKYIVGWYKDATVFRERQTPPASSKRAELHRDGVLETDKYMIRCTENNAHLIPPEERNFYVPTARTDGYGFGQSFLWYPTKNDAPAVQDYLDKTLKYVENIDSAAANVIEEIEKPAPATSKIAGAEKAALVKVRIGQSEYRRRLLNRDGACRLCRADISELLIASHIKPWSASDALEKCDEDNGILLCPNHDALFDKGLISFSDDGEILISDDLDERNRERFGVKIGQKISVTPEMKFYLEWHRSHVFNNKKG